MSLDTIDTISLHQAGCRPSTQAVRAGIDRDTAFGAVTPPLVLSSNFSFAGFAEKRQYDYSRSGNPTRDLLGEALAQLEGGAGGVVTSTGMSAITLVLNALLQPGDRLVVPHDCYGGSWRLFNALAKKGAFELLTVDLTDPRALAEALAVSEDGCSPALVWIETPSNPLLRITDLRFVIDASHKAGALVVVDNTFLSPALQRPIADFQADVVVHSTTKYIGGHSDVLGGAVIVAERAFRGQDLAESVGFQQFAGGAVAGPQDCFLAARGLKTLGLRMERHCSNAATIAGWLQGRGEVETVLYPGLETHPGHELAKSQSNGFGGIVSLQFAGGEAAARAFAESTQLFALSVSLGGVESLVCYSAEMTHASVIGTPLAVPRNLVRLSVGIEQVEDLIADLELGLAAARSASLQGAAA